MPPRFTAGPGPGAYWESAYKPKTSAASGTILWVELAADPNSSKLLVALGDCQRLPLHGGLGRLELGHGARGIDRPSFTVWYGRRFAVSFESGSGHQGHAIIAYSDSANLKYRHSSDISGAWGSETDISTSYDCNWVELALDADNTIHLMCQEEDGPDDLLAYTWNNSSWTSEGILETDLQYDSNGTYEAFAITTFPPAAASDAGMAGMGPMVGYSVSTSPQWVTRYSIWDGSDFSPESTGPTFGASVNIDWVVVETTPTGKMMVGKDNANNAYASFFDGTSWGPVKSLGAVANNGSRGFDAAVERLSGRVMIVAGSGTSLKYWVYDGGSWVVDGSTVSGSLGSGTKYFVEMASHPSSNEIALTFCDSVNDAYGVIWSGSAWGNEQILDANLSLSNYFQPVGVEYIRSGSGAGKAMFAWGATDGTAKMESRTWNGSTWDSEFAAIDPGGGICYLRLHADPNSNRMVCAITRSNWTGVVAVFNGTSWDSPVTVDTLFGHAYRPIDAIFETASGHEGDLLVVYSDATNLRYVHADWNGSSYSWGSETNVDVNYDGLWVQLEYAANDTILLAVRDNSANKLGTWSWNNSSLTAERVITSSLTSLSQSHQPFYLSPKGYFDTGMTQAHYRWRNDDGSESAATFAVTEDKKMGLAKQTTKRLRFLVNNTGGTTLPAFQLQVAETATCSSGTYYPVGGGSGAGTHWAMSASGYLADGGMTSNVASGLTDPGSTSFVGGQVKESGSTTGTLSVGANEFVEVEYSIQATASATSSGDYCFRLYDAYQQSPFGTYTNYAQAQVLGVTAVRLLSFEAKGEGEAVAVSWQTGQEVKNKGFELYRAASLRGEYVKLNPGLIPSISVSGEGRSYRFLDADVVRGRLYYYRLEDVDVLGDPHAARAHLCRLGRGRDS